MLVYEVTQKRERGKSRKGYGNKKKFGSIFSTAENKNSFNGVFRVNFEVY
jgi:hypothetical protein